MGGGEEVVCRTGVVGQCVNAAIEMRRAAAAAGMAAAAVGRLRASLSFHARVCAVRVGSVLMSVMHASTPSPHHPPAIRPRTDAR